MDNKQLLELKQERATLTGNLRALMNSYEGKEMPAEKQAELKRNEDEFDKINALILQEEKQMERERTIGETVASSTAKMPQAQSKLFAQALAGDTEANARYVQEYKAAYTLGTDDTAGALTAPMDFVNELIRGLNDYSFVRAISKVVGPIGAAQSLGFPYRKAGATNATWTAETGAAQEETTLSFGRREFKPNRLTKLIKISSALVNHSEGAVKTILDEILYVLSITQENAYLTGDGSSKPLGVFTASANGISTARDISTGNTDTDVTADGLIAAKYALKQQYIERGAEWIMHRDIAKSIATMKDSNGSYIWQPSLQLGAPDLLLGCKVNQSEYAPNTKTAGKYVAVLGCFKEGYRICDADALTIQVLKELYAVNGQIGYLVNYYGDGMPVLEEAFVRVKLAAAQGG